MGVWQKKENLLAQLRSPIYEQQEEAADQLEDFNDPVFDADVVRGLLEVMAKRNKRGNSCWRVTHKGLLKNPAVGDLCFCHTARRQIKSPDELLRILRNNNDFPGAGTDVKHIVPSDKILAQAVWVLGRLETDLSAHKDKIKKELNDLISSGLFGDDVICAAISALDDLKMLSEEEILAALKNPHPQIRWNMLKALTKVNPHPRTIALLVDQMLRREVSPAMRSMIVKNMVNIKDPRIDEPLTALLLDDNPNIREHAALSLGERNSH